MEWKQHARGGIKDDSKISNQSDWEDVGRLTR